MRKLALLSAASEGLLADARTSARAAGGGIVLAAARLGMLSARSRLRPVVRSWEDLVDYRRLPLIVVIAKQHHQYIRTLVPVYVAALLFTISWASLSNDAVVHYLSLGIAAVLLVVGVWMLVTFRRSDVFIATHTDRIYVRTAAWELLVDDLYEKERLEALGSGTDDAADSAPIANGSHPDETTNNRG